MAFNRFTKEQPILDLAGLGIGPFNLSLAALLDSLPEVKARFFDRKENFSWHPGLMLPGTHMQTSCLKDMVTAVQPTSRWSFLSYLVDKGRFYQFLSTEKMVISRREFVDYMNWVAHQLQSLQFASDTREVHFSGEQFLLKFSNNTEVTAKNLCLGTGKVPHVPDCIKPYLGTDCLHASDLGKKTPDLQGKRVAIIGGGQTGAEVFLNSLREKWATADKIYWVSRRSNFEPLDESPFTNEYFTPDYVANFLTLPCEKKDAIVHRQKLASDGITPDYLLELYRELYDRTYLSNGLNREQGTQWQLMPDRTLVNADKRHDGLFNLTINNALNDNNEQLTVDAVILCTGFEHQLPQYLEPLTPYLELDMHGRFNLTPEFRIKWNGPEDNRIYAMNAGMHSHGIAEPQLSLAAWRSATIINDFTRREVFNIQEPESLIQWRTLSQA